MIIHVNRLLADYAREISSLICFLKKQQNLKMSSALYGLNVQGKWG